jgi:hypothetical protein
MDIKDLNITPDHVARMVMLTYGKMVNSKPFWCFVAVKPTRQDELKKHIAGKTFDINNFEKDGFGEIVVSGEGVIPPNDIIKKVAAMFNVPIRDFFKDFDQDAVITKEIERVKKDLGIS